MKKLAVSSCMNLHCYSRENISEYVRVGLEFQKKMGFEAVDIGMSMFDLSSDNSWQPQIERALNDFDEVGIRPAMCHLPFIGGGGAKDEAYMTAFGEKMHRAIDAAVLIGAEYAVLHPNATTLPMKKYDRKEQFELTVSHLAPFAEHAERVGLKIVVENMRVIPTFVMSHRFCQEPDELCDVADALGIGVCWDFGHANISGIKQSEGLSYVGKRLKVIHINDNSAVDDEHLAPFMGNVDWKDAMHGLALVGYEGPFNFELSAGKLPGAVREAYAKYVVDAAHELLSYIK